MLLQDSARLSLSKSSAVRGRFFLRLAAYTAIAAFAVPVAAPAQAGTPVLLDAMTTELNRAFSLLGKQGGDKQLPPYFLSYAVSDATSVSIARNLAPLPIARQTTCAWPTCRCGWARRRSTTRMATIGAPP